MLLVKCGLLRPQPNSQQIMDEDWQATVVVFVVVECIILGKYIRYDEETHLNSKWVLRVRNCHL